ncbi:ABC transporter substrate-binding protein [soil metagenome]
MYRILSVFFVVLALASCGDSSGVQPAQSDAPATLNGPAWVPVSILLNWFPEAEHGGYFCAAVEGEFDKAGIGISIIPGGVNAGVVARVASEQVTFGVCNADDVIYGRAEQADVVVIFAPIQKSPRVIMVHEESPIDSFDKLTSVTLAMSKNRAFSLYLEKKFPLKDVQVVAYSGNVAQFLLNKNYAQQGYNFSEPFVAQKQGAKVRNLFVADAGFNPYTSVLIVSRKYMDAHKETVARVVSACEAGWRRYGDDSKKTNEYIHSKNKQMDMDVLQFGASELKPMVLTDETKQSGIGAMTAERWDTLVAQMEEIGAVGAGKVKASECFTTEFLKTKTPATE